MNARYGEELFDLLRRIELPSGDFAVFGSGPLLIRGIITSANDLDVICRSAAWEHACRHGTPVTLDDGIEIMSFHDGAITCGTGWRYGDFDVDALIDSAEVIAGLPFVPIEHVVTFKRIAQRPKDLEHLAALAEYESRL